MQELVRAAGAVRTGVAQACPVPQSVHLAYMKWVERGCHATMDYLDRYHDVRRDPRLLLEGAASIISFAVPYRHPLSGTTRQGSRIASYALGRDYHDVLRKSLKRIAAEIESRYGGTTRVCVDTAPLHERYWAARSGVGRIGRNKQLIVPGAGSYCFLGEILTTVSFTPTQPLEGDPCGKCRRCLEACPGKALGEDGTLDAHRCISYLTIEHRGPLPSGTNLHGCLYGCDTCADACPHNTAPAMTTLPELFPRPELLQLDAEAVMNLDAEAYAALTRGSAIKRAKLEGLQRNASLLPGKGLRD